MMRTPDSIKSEIGQLESHVRELESRIVNLKDELAESELVDMGFKIGQIIKFPYGQGTSKGKITGFVYSCGATVRYKTIKKNGVLGEERDLPFYQVRSALIIKDAPCA